MDSQSNVEFTSDPCPLCKMGGNETGYRVDPDCPHCLGTGHARIDLDLNKKIGYWKPSDG